MAGIRGQLRPRALGMMVRSGQGEAKTGCGVRCDAAKSDPFNVRSSPGPRSGPIRDLNGIDRVVSEGGDTEMRLRQNQLLSRERMTMRK